MAKAHPITKPKLTKKDLKIIETKANTIYLKLLKEVFVPMPDNMLEKGIDSFSYCEGVNGALWSLSKLLATREHKCNPPENTSTLPSSQTSNVAPELTNIDMSQDIAPPVMLSTSTSGNFSAAP